MLSKRFRHSHILELVGHESLPSQEDLRRRLARRGMRVTQATLSRDLRELGLVKTSSGYSLPATPGSAGPPAPPLAHLLKDFVVDVREAQNLLLVRTNPGSAQPVAAALDSQQWHELIGTVAGDDTVLVVTPNRRACRRLRHRVLEHIG